MFFILLSLLAPKKVTKKRHPFVRSRKTGFPCYRIFCGRRHKLVPLCRDSDMRRLRFTKKSITAARSKWGPDFLWSPLGTNIWQRLLDVDYYNFFLMVKPMIRHVISPIITKRGPSSPVPFGLLAAVKLWAMAAPKTIPHTNTAASLSPSPDINSCLPGHPPASAKASPERTIPQEIP